MAEKLRLVIDTNILLDIVYFNDERVQDLKKRIEDDQLEVWSCPTIWEEFIAVLKRPAFFKNEEFFNQVLQTARRYFKFEILPIPLSPFKCKDKDDQIFIDLAVLKTPCWLLSRDLEVIKLSRRLKTIGVNVGQTITSA